MNTNREPELPVPSSYKMKARGYGNGGIFFALFKSLLFMAGGEGGKSEGGPSKIFSCVESGHQKRIRSPEFTSRHFFPKYFAAGSVSFICLHYPFIG